MNKTAIQIVILAMILIVAQALVFDNICLFNVAMPIVFIYIIFKLPMTMGVNSVLTVSFLLGLMIDIFANTYGMNALCSTVAGMSRRGVFHLYMPRDEDMSDPVPSARSMGRYTYLKYMATMTLFYSMMIFTVEAFTFFHVGLTIARIFASAVLSLLLMLAIDSLTVRRHEKRL